MSKRLALLPLSIVLFQAGAATAQTSDARVFVDANGFANTAWLSGAEADTIGGATLSGTVGGGGFSVGTRLAPRFSLRFEFAALADLSDSRTSQYTIDDSGLFPPGVTIYPLVYTTTTTTTVRDRERTAGVLVGYHTMRRSRVELAYLGGVVFVFDRRTQTLLRETTPATGLLPETDTVILRTYGATAEVGLDADIALARHVSVVPQLRMVADGVSVRSGVALRARW